jgi:NarL family two-component system response regulator LiaR
MADRIRVLVVDDHKVVRKGLRIFFSVTEDIEVVAEARNGAEAIEQTAAHHPDVVLMDLKMPVMDGPTAIERIRTRFPTVQVVALTSFHDDALAHQALEAGAIGYVFKDADEEQLISAVRMAGTGKGAIASEIVHALLNRPEPEPRLTQRERDVLRHVAQGMTNPQIATRLFISVSTVGFHLHNILTKLDAKTRTEAVTIAAREGLIDL